MELVYQLHGVVDLLRMHLGAVVATLEAYPRITVAVLTAACAFGLVLAGNVFKLFGKVVWLLGVIVCTAMLVAALAFAFLTFVR